MPIETTALKDQDLTIFTATGELTFEEQMAVLREFYAGTPTRNVIWDFTDITGSRISSTQLREIMDLVQDNRAKRTGGKTAFVAATDLDFGLSRMGAGISQGRELPLEMEAFRSLDDARAWIAGKGRTENGGQK